MERLLEGLNLDSTIGEAISAVNGIMIAHATPDFAAVILCAAVAAGPGHDILRGGIFGIVRWLGSCWEN